MLLYYFQIIIFNTWLYILVLRISPLEIGESDVKQHLLLLSVLGRQEYNNVVLLFLPSILLDVICQQNKMKVGAYSDIWFLEIWG